MRGENKGIREGKSDMNEPKGGEADVGAEAGPGRLDKGGNTEGRAEVAVGRVGNAAGERQAKWQQEMSEGTHR